MLEVPERLLSPKQSRQHAEAQRYRTRDEDGRPRARDGELTRERLKARIDELRGDCCLEPAGEVASIPMKPSSRYHSGR